jgi:predicted DNA-binding ribbon-helix-helix protein
MHGKRVQFDDETWLALDVLARDRMMTFQELADEAFDDLLEKYHRPTNLKSALKQSAGMEALVPSPAIKTRQRKRAKNHP